MARCIERDCRRRYGKSSKNHTTRHLHWTGPAHAVYFGTYEVVKEMAGGNAQDGKHHPLAAGMIHSQASSELFTDVPQLQVVLQQRLPAMR